MIFCNLLCSLKNALRRFSRPRAGVALIVALSTPLLLAATGLSVDVGYWYQQQEILQSAADAAALAAATSDAKYGVTSIPVAEPYALAAANSASNSQFGLTASSLSVSCTSTSSSGACGTTAGTNSTDTWTATATIPRGSFFSGVRGMGLTGMLAGTQSASAIASVKSTSVTSNGSCLLALSQTQQSEVGANGNGTIIAKNCGIQANSNYGLVNGSCSGSSGGAISTVGTNATIEAQTITAVGCVAAGTGTIAAGSGGNYLAANVQTGGTVQSDPLAAMGDPPTDWQSVPIGTAAGDIPLCIATTNSSGSIIVSPPDDYKSCSYNGSINIPSQGSVTFAPGSYFFPNGFSQTGKTNVTFGPGIYYFDGSTGLTITGGATYTANGATFVFEGTSSYTMGGSSSTLNLSAPSSNCVQPSSYPESVAPNNYTTATPYDGTNGEGVCGILIYQARGDTKGGTLKGGSSAIVNGVIYTPSASFSDVGGASVSAATGGTLAVLSSSFSVSGNGVLNLAIGTDTAGLIVKATTTNTITTLLVG